MDADDGGKKTGKEIKLFKEEFGPSSKSSDKVGASAEMNVDGGKKKSEIDKDEKFAHRGAKKRKFSATDREDQETSPKCSLRSGKKRSEEIELGEVSKQNSNEDDKGADIGYGKGELAIGEVGSEKTSKRDEDERTAKGQEEKTVIDLPSELLVNIIDLLPISQWASLESLSRQFRNTVHGMWGQLRDIHLDELVYNEKKKTADPCKVLEAILEKFLIRAPNVASICGFDEFFGRGTSIRLKTIELLSKFEHLQLIDFSDQNVITAEIFAIFLESSPNRQSWKCVNIVDGIFGYMEKSHNAVGIKDQPDLNLECFKISVESWHIFHRYLQIDWRRLKKLIIVDSNLFPSNMLQFIGQCTQLAHLEFEVPLCSNGNGQTTYGDLMQAVAELENLSILKIIVYVWRDEAFYDALLELIQNLSRRRRPITDLALTCHLQCSVQIVDAIVDLRPHLKAMELNVEHCTTESLKHLVNTLGLLETLKLRSRFAYNVDGTVVQAIGANMCNLQCLHVEYPKCNWEDLISLADL